ncbi:hypothetical protein PSCLAVI8L_150120 [Pseudoclavibacter sp. 8L]|nr:hypothetical protein PSCLAVI8L_150120 [Pseudoclavibacter sp. 8L]
MERFWHHSPSFVPSKSQSSPNSLLVGSVGHVRLSGAVVVIWTSCPGSRRDALLRKDAGSSSPHPTLGGAEP